ncbi:polyprotein [Pseudomonas syringae pv. syringae]|nr:polyprotein [Pseudomonas syringae pv. syringae]
MPGLVPGIFLSAVWLSGCLAVWLSGCLAVWLAGRRDAASVPPSAFGLID